MALQLSGVASVLLNNRFIVVMVLGIFMLVGCDVAMNSNIANFLQNNFGLTLERASLGISHLFCCIDDRKIFRGNNPELDFIAEISSSHGYCCPDKLACHAGCQVSELLYRLQYSW